MSIDWESFAVGAMVCFWLWFFFLLPWNLRLLSTRHDAIADATREISDDYINALVEADSQINRLVSENDELVRFIGKEYPMLPLDFNKGKIRIACKTFEIESNGLVSGTEVYINGQKTRLINKIRFELDASSDSRVADVNLTMTGIPRSKEVKSGRGWHWYNKEWQLQMHDAEVNATALPT